MTKRRYGIYHELEVRGRSAEIEQQSFAETMSQIELADRLGYDSAWFVEHHFTRGFSHSSAPDLVLAAVARSTERIRLGLGVSLLPFLSPIRVAERVGTLDVVSGGRVEFGTGRGASPLEYQAFQRPFEQSREIWEDHLDAVKEIFAANGGEVTREGRYYEIPGVSVLPRPVQQPGPPIWVASTSLAGFLAAAKGGYNLLCIPILKGLPALAEDIAQYKQALAEHGHDPDKARIGCLVPWYVDAENSGLDEAVSAFMWYIRRQVNLVTPPDYTDAQHATYKVFGQLAAGMSEEKAIATLNEHRMIVMGDVQESRRAMEEFFDAGVTDLLGQFRVGGLSNELVSRSMELFATEVAQI
ncbi:MAG: LLM class flavin-dependent oxidoreductase [Halioglobus sp.]|nr:LLM class flavin-dependent oxidoreductase [Halioglobus sp.]|tara:strand:- start:1288 stop:2355 length:1068 start_codon:yes stop_codon:yes gene_type:complete